VSRHLSIVDVHVILRRDGRILLGRRTGSGFGDGLLHLPSGHLEAGESVTGAAIREAYEEIGVVVGGADLRFVHVMHRAPDTGPDRVGFFFAADRWLGEPEIKEPDKCTELVWADPLALPPDVVEYPALALTAALAGRPFSEYAWLGLAYGTVNVVEHRPEWTEAGARLVRSVADALGPLADAVEHVGSTAVPGLPAKPILDIGVRLAPQADIAAVVDALTTAGFVYRGDKGEFGRHLFVAETRSEFRVAHLHVIPHGDPQFDRYLVVREALRSDPEARDRYAAVKRDLAVRNATDSWAYTLGKDAFFTPFWSARPEA
jgi:8-oxo-dGTP diphosphatase